METWLKAKTAGLPRWAWIGGLTGAVVLGLYLRSRNKATEEELGPEEGSEAGEGEEGQYFGEGGMAGAGLIGGGSNATTPVQTPYIPEGITEIIGTLGGIIGQQNETEKELAGIIGAAREGTGGSPPEAGFHETPPAPAPGGSGGGTTTKPKPTCPQSVKNKIDQNKSEMSRLQSEAQKLRGEAQSMNNTEKRGGETKQGKQNNAASKESKVGQLSNENNKLRNTPGCS